MIIERKSINDFATSIVDGRLFSQLNNYSLEQSRTGKIVVLMIHGWYLDNPRVTRDQLEGAIASVGVHYGIVVYWVPDIETACRLIVKFCQKVEEGKWLTPRMVWKKNAKKAPRIVTALQRFLGVPSKTAGYMLLSFGSIRRLANATKEELTNIPGMGKIRTERVYAFLNKDWRKKKDAKSK